MNEGYHGHDQDHQNKKQANLDLNDKDMGNNDNLILNGQEQTIDIPCNGTMIYVDVLCVELTYLGMIVIDM